jgi:hypothetical protein
MASNKKRNNNNQSNAIPNKIVSEEVYIPSENADKYPDIKKVEYQYKILASRNDYIKLQEDVTKHLNEGWELVGGVSTTMNVSPYESVTIFAQAIKK